MSLQLEDINIILIARNSPKLNQYKKYLAEKRIRFYAIQSEAQLENILEIIPVNGIMVDITTAIKATGTEKMLISSLEEYYPVVRVRWNDEKQGVDAMFPDDNVNTFDDFVKKKCMKFDPRVMRTSQRTSVSLNVTISQNSGFVGKKEKTCTLNASDTGLFVITASPFWQEKQKLYVRINELSNQAGIEGTIVRKIEWGEEKLTTPGISIRFDSILDSQQDELFKLLSQ